MKISALIVALVIFTILLTGCGGKMSNEDIVTQSVNNNMFITVSKENSGRIIVDKDTNVMYWMSYGAYNYGTLTLMVNPDGTPKTWKE